MGPQAVICTSARKALFAVYGRCHELHIHQPLLKCQLFDALVRPIMTYACEVWAVMDGTKTALEQIERIHVGFFKRLLGVPASTSSRLVYAEFGRLPLSHVWLQQCLKYLKRFHDMEDGKLCKVAFMADRQNGLGWYSGLIVRLLQCNIRLRAPGRTIKVL